MQPLQSAVTKTIFSGLYMLFPYEINYMIRVLEKGMTIDINQSSPETSVLTSNRTFDLLFIFDFDLYCAHRRPSLKKT